MKREITFWEASAACLALSLLSFLAGMLEGRTMRGSTPAEQTVSRDTIIITDTVFVPSPSDTVVKTISKVVMVPVHTAANDIGVDSVPVLLPFDQHFTRLGDVADVWYSGFQASIDSASTPQMIAMTSSWRFRSRRYFTRKMTNGIEKSAKSAPLFT